jgi:hypothetical protein
MSTPVTGAHAPEMPHPSHAWLTPDVLQRVRRILLGLTLFVALAVWILYSLGFHARGGALVFKLRAVGVMTWIYALVQLIDHRFWNSRFAQRRRAALQIPESLFGWLLGQMLAWYGIVYYALTQDARWYAGGLVLLLASFLAFPIHHDD